MSEFTESKTVNLDWVESLLSQFDSASLRLTEAVRKKGIEDETLVNAFAAAQAAIWEEQEAGIEYSSLELNLLAVRATFGVLLSDLDATEDDIEELACCQDPGKSPDTFRHTAWRITQKVRNAYGREWRPVFDIPEADVDSSEET